MRDPKDKATLEKVNKALIDLPGGIRKLFYVLNKQAVTNAQGDPNTALALAAYQGISFRSTATGELLIAAKGGTNCYMPPDFKEFKSAFLPSAVALNKG